MVVLHGAEGPFCHGVLKINGRLEGGDFAGEVVPEEEVLRAPGDPLAGADETRSDSFEGKGLFSEVYVSREMRFDTASEIEAAFDGRLNGGELFQFDHFETPWFGAGW